MREKEDEIIEICKGQLLINHGKESEFYSSSKGKSLTNLKHRRKTYALIYSSELRAYWPLWRGNRRVSRPVWSAERSWCGSRQLVSSQIPDIFLKIPVTLF